MLFLIKSVLKEITSDYIITTKIIDAVTDFTFKLNYTSIFTLNINSIRAHFVDLVIYLSFIKEHFNVIILTETWLLTDFNYTLNGFVCINSIGIFYKCDGVTIMTKYHNNSKCQYKYNSFL